MRVPRRPASRRPLLVRERLNQERLMAELPQHPSDTNQSPGAESLLSRMVRIVSDELVGFHPRLQLARFVCGPLPNMVGNRFRVYALRAAGFQIGKGCMMYSMPRFIGGREIHRKLKIGQRCLINVGCQFDLASSITIGDQVQVGPEALFLTASHEIGTSDQRAGTLIASPITVGDGVWIGARSIILPGLTIGSGSVVGAGSIVTRNIPPCSLAMGQPARVVRSI